MSSELTDGVPGSTEETVAAWAAEAEAGYDLTDRVPEPNPHFTGMPLVPADLLAAIDERARRDGETPAAVVRRALTSYLHTA